MRYFILTIFNQEINQSKKEEEGKPVMFRKKCCDKGNNVTE